MEEVSAAIWSGKCCSVAAAAAVSVSARVSTTERDATRKILILSVAKKTKDPQTYAP